MMIRCETCKQEYEALWENPPNQFNAADCASMADKDGVQSFYGSRYDTNKYKWVVGKPIHVKLGIICDACMAPMIGSGALRFECNYMDGSSND